MYKMWCHSVLLNSSDTLSNINYVTPPKTKTVFGLHYGVWIVQEMGCGKPGVGHVNYFTSVITVRIIETFCLCELGQLLETDCSKGGMVPFVSVWEVSHVTCLLFHVERWWSKTVHCVRQLRKKQEGSGTRYILSCPRALHLQLDPISYSSLYSIKDPVGN